MKLRTEQEKEHAKRNLLRKRAGLPTIPFVPSISTNFSPTMKTRNRPKQHKKGKNYVIYRRGKHKKHR